jgi:surface-anchored protein
MKKQNTQIIGRIRQLGLAALLTTGLASQAQTILTNQHADIGVTYEGGAWNLHIHNETEDIEYSPPSGLNGAILQVGSAAASSVSVNPLFSFLGPAGSSVWILPNTQNPNLIFLGFGAEELATGLFVGDSVNMALHSISGPGEFAVFDYDFFGNPTALMNTRDGITAGDSVSLAAGAHNDLNWAFSAPGTYTVNFEASGTLVDGNVFTASGPVGYTFEVMAVPEPSSMALAGVGALALLLVRKMRRD